MPLNLLRATSLDLISNLEAQLSRAKNLISAATSYQDTQDPRDLAAIVYQLERIRLLHELTTDILYSARIALDAANQQDSIT